MNINIAGIEPESTVDGPGIRYAIYTQGCPHGCIECHNPETWDSENGKKISINKIISDITSNPLLTGVTFSGGEPFMQIEPLVFLAQEIKKIDLNIIAYTGYLFEDLIQNEDSLKLLQLIDILVDGPYMNNKKDLKLAFKGSSNQRVIDVRKSINMNKIVELNDDEFKMFFIKKRRK